MPGWGREGEGEGERDGGRAQRTAEPAGHGLLLRSLPRHIPASPLPSSPRCEQHPLQTLGPYSWGRQAPAAPRNYPSPLAKLETFSTRSRESGVALPARIFPGVHWGTVSGKGLQGPRETSATCNLPPAGLPSGLGNLSSPLPQP